MHEYIDGLTSYIVAAVAILMLHANEITVIGGLILLVVRFIADAPRAYANIKKLFKK